MTGAGHSGFIGRYDSWFERTAGGRHGARDGHARGAGREIDLGSAAGRPGRGRSNQLVRRPDIFDEDRRRGERLPAGRDLGDDAARWGNHGRNTQLALAAAAQAIEQSGLTEYAGEKRAIRGLPRGRGRPAGFFAFRRSGVPEQAWGEGRHRGVHAARAGNARSTQRGGAGAGNSGRAPCERFRRRGPNLSCLTACAASAQAIGEAVEIIRRGSADVMLLGACTA